MEMVAYCCMLSNSLLVLIFFFFFCKHEFALVDHGIAALRICDRIMLVQTHMWRQRI
jgi:hypothetical protein